MFFSGGLFILLAVLFLLLVGVFLFSRKFAWFGQLPGDIRSEGRRTRVYAPLASMVIDPTRVKGWGVDANPKNDPTYPMKKRTDGEHAGYSWERPPQQPVSVEVLHSNERPNVSATCGASTPPAGLSGVIRRAAFKYSENSYGH